MNPLVTVLIALGSILSGGGIVALINALARKKLTKVDVAEKVNEIALEWATTVKADAEEARHEAQEARREAIETHRQMTAVRREATALAEDLHRLRQAILDPDATLDKLRAMVWVMNERSGS
jgi:uncharacterized coiled-coil DUF342 family protein